MQKRLHNYMKTIVAALGDGTTIDAEDLLGWWAGPIPQPVDPRE